MRVSGLPQDEYKFGPFRFSRKDLHLWNGMIRVPLKRQPARLLELLLDRNGQPVSRAEMETHLWPNGAKHEVAVGQQINSCVWLIRQTLHDNAKAPVYVAKREEGYEFIAPVRSADGHDRDGPPLTLGDGSNQATTNPTKVGQDHRPAPPAFGSDIDNKKAQGDVTLKGEHPTRESGKIKRLPRGLLAAQVASLIATYLATDAAAFGAAIVFSLVSCLFGILLYTHVEDAPMSRFSLAVLFGAVIGYAPTAATLSLALTSVVNATTIKTAVVYPFITGLQFVPLYLVVLAHWVALAWYEDHGFRLHRLFRDSYLFGGAVALSATVVAAVVGSGDIEIWRNAVPGQRTLLAAYTVIVAMNIAIWVVGFRHFDRAKIDDYTPLFLWALVFYLPLAFAAFVAGREYNSINRHYLDKRRPQAFMVRNPGGIVAFQGQGPTPDGDIGPDLRSLINDPEFERSLQTQRFYKQDFDEPFQVFQKAEMFGFQTIRRAGETHFTIVRFPRRMTEALRFEAVQE